MLVSQKERYALRAIFELAKREGSGPLKAGEIAEAQRIPVRFLEVILNELKQAGFVAARRGSRGGFLLVRDPATLTVGEVMRFLRGAEEDQFEDGSSPLATESVFRPMWRKVEHAISDVLDGATFGELVEEEKRRAERFVPTYAI